MEAIYNGIKFNESHVVEPDEFVPEGDYNPHNIRPWLIWSRCGFSSFAVAVVFAEHEQDAFDAATDDDRMEACAIPADELEEAEREERVTYLGNASEPFDLTDIGIFEMPNPKYSWTAMFAARGEGKCQKCGESMRFDLTLCDTCKLHA